MIEPRNYLHRAPWVVPMSDDLPAVIRDGAVLTEEGRIARVGTYAELRARESEAVPVEHDGRVLLPGLVNCHAHLELSYLARMGQGEGHSGPMSGWIRGLMAERMKSADPEEVLMAAWQALAQLYSSGCRALLDIGNDPASREIGANFKVEIRFFLEFFGLATARAAELTAMVDELPADLALTGHAPHSTRPELLQFLKERASRTERLFSVHLAESMDEVEFLATGGGPFREFLEERQSWDGNFVAPGISPVAYLAELGLLDNRTLAVHCVQVDETDIELLARSGSTVCLCPGSNRFLGVGTAPVPALAAAGVPLVLGTDSLASNQSLDLWAEMRQLRRDHPGLAPLEVLRMATVNGANLLELAGEFGSLTPGRSASFLAVTLDAAEEAGDEEILATIVDSGLPAELEWVE